MEIRGLAIVLPREGMVYEIAKAFKEQCEAIGCEYDEREEFSYSELMNIQNLDLRIFWIGRWIRIDGKYDKKSSRKNNSFIVYKF